MAYSNKPIVAIIGSKNIYYLDLNFYIAPKHCGEVIGGTETTLDIIIEQWAKKNKIEYLDFKPNYQVFKDKALTAQKEDMINASDIAIFFWDGESPDVPQAIHYCDTIGRKYICHLIIDA